MIAILLKGDTYAPEIKIHFKFKYLFITVVCLLIGVVQTFAQNGNVQKPNTLKGKVISAVDGQFLPRATIKIKGTNQTTITNEKGEFSLATDKTNGILEISFLGYLKQEVAFNNSAKPILITLEKDEQQLQEVEISTGYQNFSPERFVGSASKLDSSTFHRQAGVNIMDRLNGTVTGLLFGRRSAFAASQIPTIRGVSTINNTESSPLIVVDNFPMDDRFDMNSINPNDIQDISVLKDAAAASIWGARAGNGVIVITTKKANYNQKLKIDFNSNIAITDKPDFYANPNLKIDDFIELERLLFDKGFYTAVLNNATNRPAVSPVVELLNQVKNGGLDPAKAEAEIKKYKTYDIRDDLNQYIYQNSINQQHHLSFKGGSSSSNYLLNFGYNHSLSNIQSSKGDPQFTVNSTYNLRPMKNLEINTNLNYVKSTTYGSLSPSLSPFPYERLADENGNPLATSWQYRTGYLDTAGAGKLLDWQYRPLDEMRFVDNTTKNQSINLNLGASYHFIEGLTGKVLYNYRNQTTFGKNHKSIETFDTRHSINKFSVIKGDDVTRPFPLGGTLNLNDVQTVSQQIRAQLDFNKVWSNHHRVAAMLVGEASETNSGRHSNSYYGYDDRYETFASAINHEMSYPTYGRIGGFTAKIPAGESLSSGQISRLVSFLANASYTYKNLYTLYSSARRDGSNIFGVNTNQKWKPLWSIGANWNISNEEFFSSSWINSLRLRGSFGYMGNTTILSGLTTIIYQPNRDEYTDLITAIMGNPPNPNLRWEEIETINTGLDFSLFNNRLSGSVDLFNKAAKDLIAVMLIDPTVGLERSQINSASLRTRGSEIKLNSRNTIGSVDWTTNFGFSHVKTIVTKLFENGYRAGDFINYNLNPSEGQIAYGLSSYRWAGLDPKTGDPQGYLNGEISKNYRAIDNDSIQNQVFHGSSKPLTFGFINNTITWKNLSLSATISYSFDYFFRNPTINYNLLFSQRKGHTDYYIRWQKEGDESKTTVPSLNYPADLNRDSFYSNSEVNVLKGDHIRLRDIRLAYLIGKEQIGRLPVQSIQVFMYANNLNIMLWKANKSAIDPDYVYSDGYTNFPTPKTWTAGLTINF